MRWHLRVFRLCLAVVVATLPAWRAHANDLSAPKQAVFLARVLGYDANLKSRAGNAVNIALLAKKGDRDSEEMAEVLFKAFSQLESATLLGLPVRISHIYFTGRDALSKAIRDGGIDTLYVCRGLDANLGEIKSEARMRKVLTVASEEEQLKNGLSLGLFEMAGKNAILVNLEASREEGVSFGPDLLRLATVVR
jgi:hypothetical protein